MSDKDENYLRAEPCGNVLKIEAADGEEKKLPTINIEAYNGGAIGQWWGQTVVDLEGLEVAENVSILANHNPETPIGHAPASSIDITESGIQLSGGVLSGDPDDPDTRRVLRMAENGYPWQASIGAPIYRKEEVEEGQTVEVNGREFNGPISVIRAAKLKEISVLTMGADETTRAEIEADARFNHQPLTEKIMGLEDNGDSLEPQKVEAVQAVDNTKEVESLKAQLSEMERINGIKSVEGEHVELKAKAIADGWSVDQLQASVSEVEKIRAERSAPIFNIGGKEGNAEGSIEAGFAMSCGVKADSLKGDFSEDALNDALKVKANSFSQLANMLLAKSGKYNPMWSKEETLEAAFSTVGMSSILSNTANKILLDRYMSTPGVSDLLSVERKVSDFKEISMQDLTMDLTLKEIGETGEAEHGTVGDTAQSASVKSYARQFVVDRQMLINDDLGAFELVFGGYGKGARTAEERNFFSVFTGATAGSNLTTGSALSIDSLTEAFTKLGKQVDENGDPIDINGALLVVPSALMTYAKQLQTSMYVNETTAEGVAAPSSNPHMGAFQTVVAPYLSNANISGGSDTRWYLMAAPSSIPSFAKLHLTSAPMPVIRRRELSIGSFGVGTDAVYDFGATAVTAKAKGIVKATGAS